MYDDNDDRKEVSHCHTDNAHNILGVMLAPDDNNRQQVERMRKIALKFGDKVRVGYICDHDILQALNSTVMRSLIYSLAVITISKEKCNHIVTPILTSVLAKMNIVGTIKRDVIYGPIHMQGMGLQKLYTLLGVIHCSLMIQFYSIETHLGQLLQTSLECMTMELGLPNDPFHYDCKNYSYTITDSWMKHIWRFRYDNGIILYRKTVIFPHNRKNDRNLMKLFVENGYQGIEFASINRCRVYLQVINLPL